MKTQSVFLDKAIEMYNGADDTTKKFLIDFFGKEHFKTPEDQVQSVQAACKILGFDYDSIFTHQVITLLEPHVVAYMEIEYVCRAINKITKFVPDYNNADQYKYFPRFYNDGSGVGFSLVDYVYAYTDTFVGARLVVGTADLAIFIGTKYMAKYHVMLGLESGKTKKK